MILVAAALGAPQHIAMNFEDEFGASPHNAVELPSFRKVK
jgi:hypothetical protein